MLISVFFTFSSYGENVESTELIQYTSKFFLLEEWSPIKEDLFVVSDPFCRFCISDLTKLKQLSEFNIFLIPSDLVSKDHAPSFIDEFYNCKFDNSKIIFKRKTAPPYFPLCEKRSKQEKEKLMYQAKRMLALIEPKYVPFYYGHGVNGMAQLLENNATLKDRANQQAVIIDWSRYRNFLMKTYQTGLSHIVLSNSSLEISELCEASKVNCYSEEYCDVSEPECQSIESELGLLLDYSSVNTAYYFEGYSINQDRLLVHLDFNN